MAAKECNWRKYQLCRGLYSARFFPYSSGLTMDKLLYSVLGTSLVI